MTPQAYLDRSIATASPAALVLALYDGALVAIGKAVDAMGRRSVEASHRELVRAQDIVHELRASLDHQRGGTIAASLEQLYLFCTDRLVAANVSKDPADLDGVREVLSGLRDAWDEACCRGPVHAVAVAASA